MLQALQGLWPWPMVTAVAVLAVVVLARAWRARRRRQRTVRREVQRLQHEFAIRDALESREDSQL